jgi:glycosyltransferase involved in cell wall biosynthesis
METTSPHEPIALTVIIPAYNVEKYIAECLQSVLNQSSEHNNLHVIVVIDGATDRTLSISQEVADQYDKVNIKIVEQNNLGLSSARNSGLAIVETEYVTFLDADDYWLPGYLDAALNALSVSSPDILEYDALMTTEDGAPISSLKISSGPEGKTSRSDKTLFLAIFRCYAWARIYRTSLFKARLFPAGRRFEDTSTIPWLYWNCKSAVSLGLPLIAYRQREGSILKSPTLTDIQDLNIATRAALSAYQNHPDEYWQLVAMRIFQQACSRITALPFRNWSHGLKEAQFCLNGRLHPGAGFLRRLQVNHTFLYVVLLRIKRNTIDKYTAFRKRMHCSKLSE